MKREAAPVEVATNPDSDKIYITQSDGTPDGHSIVELTVDEVAPLITRLQKATWEVTTRGHEEGKGLHYESSSQSSPSPSS